MLRGGSRRTPMAGSSVHAAPQHGRIIRNPRTRSSPIVQCTIRVEIDTVVEFNVLGSASEVSEPFTNARLLAAASLVNGRIGALFSVEGCRCRVNQAKSRLPGLSRSSQGPLCRVVQAKTISLIGLEVPALRTPAGAPSREVSGGRVFPLVTNRAVAGQRKA